MIEAILWVVLGIGTIASAISARKSRRAMYLGRAAVGTLYIGAGALINSVYLAIGRSYAKFADTSYIPFVRHTWRSLVVPNVHVFIPLLIAYEAVVGVLVISGGRRTQLGYVGAIGFHVALLVFGWGFYVWSIPMLIALALLLRAERRPARRETLARETESAQAIAA